MDIHQLARILANDAQVSAVDALHVLESIVELGAEHRCELLVDLIGLIWERRQKDNP
jgi:hypothetical protein